MRGSRDLCLAAPVGDPYRTVEAATVSSPTEPKGPRDAAGTKH